MKRRDFRFLAPLRHADRLWRCSFPGEDR
jgi:hypothetical protein